MDNKILSFIEDTILHKQYVLESGKLLSEYLIKNGEFDLALELLKRCAVHDNSKFEYEEIMAFASLDNSKNTPHRKHNNHRNNCFSSTPTNGCDTMRKSKKKIEHTNSTHLFYTKVYNIWFLIK